MQELLGSSQSDITEDKSEGNVSGLENEDIKCLF